MILYLFFLFAGWYALSSFASWYRLRHFKGPFLAYGAIHLWLSYGAIHLWLSYGAIHLWLSYGAITGRSWETYQGVCETYGSLARLAPDTLVTDDPDLIRRMSAARSPYRKSGFYEGMRLNPNRHTTFSTLDKVLHDQLKARTTPAYSGMDVPDLEGAVDSVVGHLQRFIHEGYVSKEGGSRSMNLAEVLHFLTLDLLAKIAQGREFGHLDSGSDVHGWIKSFGAAAPYFQLVAEIPWLRRVVFSSLVLRSVWPKPTDEKGIGKIMGIAKSVVADRFRLDAEKNDMLCETGVLLLIIAGSDNTSGTIRATLLYLMTNPRAYQKLQREIDEAAAVIQEGLRIFSPSGSLLTKQAPPEGDEFKTHRIPGGVNIGQSTWAMMRRKDLFGDDADVFQPKRFLEADPKRRDEMEKVVDLNFGYGRWGCSGKPVALMELNKVFVELCEPSNPWDVKTYPVLVIRNMNVIVTERRLI
ncbi:cytochrome p450 [Colletotrichum musicola]|uniref:Cytochrome p450 n=1 Tax=Colletotrichum musicola TaxID=2175873 RepID=A0A8H6NSK5_9PEZI|nr:cytochrome p450 [Colletotrichum musicola]